jgi:hypothetical protein
MGRKEGAQGGTPGGHVCAASQADTRRTRLRRFERVRSAALTLAPPPLIHMANAPASLLECAGRAGGKRSQGPMCILVALVWCCCAGAWLLTCRAGRIQAGRKTAAGVLGGGEETRLGRPAQGAAVRRVLHG